MSLALIDSILCQNDARLRDFLIPKFQNLNLSINKCTYIFTPCSLGRTAVDIVKNFFKKTFRVDAASPDVEEEEEEETSVEEVEDFLKRHFSVKAARPAVEDMKVVILF